MSSRMELRAWKLRTPSQVVTPSRSRSSIEYASGSHFINQYFFARAMAALRQQSLVLIPRSRRQRSRILASLRGRRGIVHGFFSSKLNLDFAAKSTGHIREGAKSQVLATAQDLGNKPFGFTQTSRELALSQPRASKGLRQRLGRLKNELLLPQSRGVFRQNLVIGGEGFLAHFFAIRFSRSSCSTRILIAFRCPQGSSRLSSSSLHGLR